MKTAVSLCIGFVWVKAESFDRSSEHSDANLGSKLGNTSAIEQLLTLQGVTEDAPV
jgi:hypothetical protein